MVRIGMTGLCIALCTISASAQGGASTATLVTGIVVDARTRQPLSDVLVAIEHATVSATTDRRGHFELALPPGDYQLSLSLVGYAPGRQALHVPSGGLSPLTIALAEGAGAFEEHITVSAAAAAGTEAAAGMSLYGRELQALRGVTLDDPLRALQNAPSAAGTDDFYAEFAVRGSGFRHTGLVVDGIPAPYLMHAVHGITDGGSIAMVNSDAVGSVALLPGSYPQRTGRRLGAQVEIGLREGDRNRVRTRVGLSGTSAAVVAEGPLGAGRGSWLVSGRRSYLDLLLARIDDGSRLAFGFSDAEAKIVYDVSARHQVQVLAIGGRSRFEEEADGLGPNDEAEVTGSTWLTSATWRYSPSATFALTQRTYATGLMHANTNVDGGVLDDAGAAEAGWRMDAAATLMPRLRIEFGADAQRLWGRHAQRRAVDDGTALSDIVDYRRTGRAFSTYGQAVLGDATGFSVTPGLRVDYWSPTAAVTASPWVTSTVAVTTGTRITAGAGVYRQFATFEQILGVRRGGTALQPETARHLDVAVSQRLPLGAELRVSGYLRREADVLWTVGAEPRRTPDGSVELGRGDARWSNDLAGHARGVEFVLRRDAPAGLSGWIGYAWGRHRYTDAERGEQFWSDYDQRHALSLFAHYRLSTRTAVSGKFRYGSNYPLTGYIGEQPFSPAAPPLFDGMRPLLFGLTDSRNTLRLPPYARLDLRIDRIFRWSDRRVTVFGEVANALNHQNLRNVPYGVDRSGRVVGPTASLLPIVPSAGFVIDF